jgi:hypothetical protein
MRYARCRACGLRIHTAEGRSTTDHCPSCGEPVIGAVPRRGGPLGRRVGRAEAAPGANARRIFLLHGSIAETALSHASNCGCDVCRAADGDQDLLARLSPLFVDVQPPSTSRHRER